MSTTILKFPARENLMEFLRHTGMTKFDIDVDELSLEAAFSEAEIELAVNGYNATCVEAKKTD